ncbi:MAG: primosomal protein N' [Alistipes sp.]|nr:primosomal protein N' [Alistipes sp.]
MYADVIVDISHDKLDKTFQYKIPAGMEESLRAGMQVNVPFGRGNHLITGYVVNITDTAAYDVARLKEIDSVVEGKIPIEGKMIKLASFIRANYGGSMNQALKTVIPVKENVKPKEKKSIHRKIGTEEARELLGVFEKKHAVARARLMECLLEEEIIEYGLVTGKLNISAAVIQYFEEQGYISIETESRYRNPVKRQERGEEQKELNAAQKYIVDCILEDYEKDLRKTYLIKGITGSGKTEVYLSVIEAVLAQGKQVIMLIPEISLTFQTVMRFYKRFGDVVSIMNSRLSKGERYDQFERAKKGLIRIMIGPRSALFTPFPNLGLIVIDEEHESAYKSENVPRYHAVGVAKELADMCNASVILGSATPSVDSYYRALSGEYRLFSLNERAAADAVLPEVTVVDLGEELKSGNRSVFSRKLKELMKDRLRKKQQTMLFINRRGYFGFISCRSCGHVMKCPHCDISLTSHKNNKLMCHYCGYTTEMAGSCPKCGSRYISALRGGTQMVEEAAAKEFPEARILRMDTDTTKGKDGHEKILSAFAAGEADILVGTQMIVKGHDYANVTLVGILAADISLHASDYRAAERTFELLTQASGRAGRGQEKGEVVIQAYDTGHFAIETAAKQDYDEFYDQEILYRTLLEYPPVSNMLLVKFSSGQEEKLIKAVNTVKITKEGVKIIGPCDAALYKADDIYNKVLYYKAGEYGRLTEIKDELERFVKDNEDFKYVSVQFDFNPMNAY